MNRLKSLLVMSSGLFLVASCSQEEITPPSSTSNRSIPIEFRAGVGSRSAFDYSIDLDHFYVTAYQNSHKMEEGDTKAPDPYFENAIFSKEDANNYTSSSTNTAWPGSGSLEFFAYAPSLEAMRSAAYSRHDPNSPNYNILKNNYDAAISFYNMCTPGASGTLDPVPGMNTTFYDQLHRGYKLGRFYVATDISKQVDFITAHTWARSPSANDPSTVTDANIGVQIDFKHQLSCVELKAFSDNPKYNIEIAGVRLGRPFTGGAIFNFCNADGDLSYEDGGKWGFAMVPERLPVEYIYGSGVGADEIVRLGAFWMNDGQTKLPTPESKDKAVSIMGKGGNAMVLPTINNAWQGKANPWISSKYNNDDTKKPNAWSREGEGDMYFSVLIRVTLKEETFTNKVTQIYPYRNNPNMNVVYLKKNKQNNTVISRVIKGTTPGANEEVVEFGWATVPVSVNWQRGYKYTYILDFTDGVGIQDPDDEDPGTPIIGDGIKIFTQVDTWKEQSDQELEFYKKDQDPVTPEEGTK